MLGQSGGAGGVIVVDDQGRVAMPFNTSGMFRGAIDTRGRLSIGAMDAVMETRV